MENFNDTEMTAHEAAAQLKPLLHKLTMKDAAFAKDVMHSTEKYGHTTGRANALIKLLKIAKGEQKAPAPEQAKVGSFAGVYALFATAKEHLKFPKIRLQTPDGEPVVLALAGPQSKTPGLVNVTDGRGYPQNKWYGRVAPDGTWTKGGKVQPEEAATVHGLLTKLAEKPAQTAAEYGRLTGRCCFCDRPLKDEQSTAAGYGPVCAAHYGLTDARKEALPVLAEAAEQEAQA